jgi:hypothetical protein
VAANRAHGTPTVSNLCCVCMLFCAELCCAVLCCAVLCCAVLCCAVLCCAVLCCAVLCCAVSVSVSVSVCSVLLCSAVDCTVGNAVMCSDARAWCLREVAAMALYLASDEAKFATGVAYPLDGGVTHVR